MFEIRDGCLLKKGRPFRIKGVNLGGWLNREGYILGGRNIAEHIIWKNIERIAGKKTADRFIRIIEENFITRKDFQIIRSLGFNAVRLPFNSRYFLTSKGSVDEKAVKKLKKTVDVIGSSRLHVILDMHAAPGSQNSDWHSDSDGRARFWESRRRQKQFLDLWKALSETFRHHPWVIGYDLMNEPNNKDHKKIFSALEKALLVIRQGGDRKILFLEGNNWSQEISFLAPFARLFENVMISVHCYEPVLFAFNIVCGLTYPGLINGRKWNKMTLKKHYQKHAEFARKNKAAIFVGEFGISSRCPRCHAELRLIDDVLDIFDDFGWHWTYWTYKSVAGMNYPDGLFQLNQNPFWLCRLHHIQSWENFASIARQGKNKDFLELARTLRTKNFDCNKALMNIVRKHLG
ncbi:MAG: cellulase family glycosylhydrolase [Candidatus Aureabacteria bacterium]|nr:cellulase family glycosylhydrolase [Candidatus Auribacterota bacterium]